MPKKIRAECNLHSAISHLAVLGCGGCTRLAVAYFTGIVQNCFTNMIQANVSFHYESTKKCWAMYILHVTSRGCDIENSIENALQNPI